jgi:[histone H3]-lysine36 N-dimethyltransferase SETMAR
MNRIQSVERHNCQLASVLRDAYGIIFIDYLEKVQTINSAYYMALLERLNDEFVGEKSTLSSRQCTVSQINQNDATVAILHELGYELLLHLPYSPDLAPSDYFLFVDL